LSGTNLCKIPVASGKNAGSLYNNGVLSLPSATYGKTTGENMIDFTNSGWDNTGVNSICAKKKWSNKVGVVWDGITNTNSC
jgi:hypothetical protein